MTIIGIGHSHLFLLFLLSKVAAGDAVQLPRSEASRGTWSYHHMMIVIRWWFHIVIRWWSYCHMMMMVIRWWSYCHMMMMVIRWWSYCHTTLLSGSSSVSNTESSGWPPCYASILSALQCIVWKWKWKHGRPVMHQRYLMLLPLFASERMVTLLLVWKKWKWWFVWKKWKLKLAWKVKVGVKKSESEN